MSAQEIKQLIRRHPAAKVHNGPASELSNAVLLGGVVAESGAVTVYIPGDVFKKTRTVR